VRFETPEEALASVEAMNNTEIDARVITVRIDRYG
jgi:RNA recognition motif-containing protein